MSTPKPPSQQSISGTVLRTRNSGWSPGDSAKLTFVLRPPVPPLWGADVEVVLSGALGNLLWSLKFDPKNGDRVEISVPQGWVAPSTGPRRLIVQTLAFEIRHLTPEGELRFQFPLPTSQAEPAHAVFNESVSVAPRPLSTISGNSSRPLSSVFRTSTASAGRQSRSTAVHPYNNTSASALTSASTPPKSPCAISNVAHAQQACQDEQRLNLLVVFLGTHNLGIATTIFVSDGTLAEGCCTTFPEVWSPSLEGRVLSVELFNQNQENTAEMTRDSVYLLEGVSFKLHSKKKYVEGKMDWHSSVQDMGSHPERRLYEVEVNKLRIKMATLGVYV
ncbi:hypothetical protein HMN09_00671000 [Mycena chlorophos]|uniref:Uncharacterized protein n=1 Tax=Mycena chlorophos TaxID=658473 RepID=A0A8H6T0X7_MYCCL|nr:hypothetical protein HMN09_00671000 [Mycena chlorophos]